MAIPPAHKSAEVIAAKAHFERVGLEGLKRLRDEEALLLGQTILMFSFNELNLRRVVEILCKKGFLEPKKKFQTWELVEKVKEGIAKAFPSDGELSDDLAKLDEIELRRPHRNVFAHWAAKRLDGMDALVFMTKDPQDAQAALGLNTEGNYGVTFSVMMVEDIRCLLNNIAKYGEWLALRTQHWYLAMGGER